MKEEDLENTNYQFTLEDGSTVEFKGNEEIEYDGGDAHRSQPVRCVKRGILREVLIGLQKPVTGKEL